MRVVYHRFAIDEADQAAVYLESQCDGLALSFLQQLNKSVLHIVASPYAYPNIQSIIRRISMERFKYNIYYRVNEDTIEIIAIRHFRRKPNNFIDRL